MDSFINYDKVVLDMQKKTQANSEKSEKIAQTETRDEIVTDTTVVDKIAETQQLTESVGDLQNHDEPTRLSVARPNKKSSTMVRQTGKPIRQTSKSSEQSRVRSSTAFVKDFPRSMLLIAQSEFPEAMNQTDALAAYVAVKSGIAEGLSPEAMLLVKNWKGDNTIESVDDRLKYLERQVSAISLGLQDLQLGIGYLTFDYLGYRRESAPKDVRSVNFLENGVSDLIKRMQEQSKQLRIQTNLKDGRPIR